MEHWQRSLKDCLTSPVELAGHFNVDIETLQPVVSRYPMRITPYYLSLIKSTGDPIWRQCIPDPEELSDNQQTDPLNEEGLSPVPGLIHRYPDRVVWLVSSQCAVNCRFCMRKGRFGCSAKRAGTNDLKRTLDYIAANQVIRDVILSGGDPLFLEDDILELALAGLRRIPHVEIIRIGTRIPVTLPERVTVKLCRLLKRFHPVYVNTHFNHPREITKASARACSRLADAGIPLGNQTVLLKGVNDNSDVMKDLFQQLLAIRVRPYYLHHMDLVRGTSHFRTKITRGLEVMDALRGHTSGLASPYYVIDLPGGKGKVPLLADYGREQEGKFLLRNYRGETFTYEDVDSS
jgi:lysine 2,3-aminomutase